MHAQHAVPVGQLHKSAPAAGALVQLSLPTAKGLLPPLEDSLHPAPAAPAVSATTPMRFIPHPHRSLQQARPASTTQHPPALGPSPNCRCARNPICSSVGGPQGCQAGGAIEPAHQATAGPPSQSLPTEPAHRARGGPWSLPTEPGRAHRASPPSPGRPTEPGYKDTTRGRQKETKLVY